MFIQNLYNVTAARNHVLQMINDMVHCSFPTLFIVYSGYISLSDASKLCLIVFVCLLLNQVTKVYNKEFIRKIMCSFELSSIVNFIQVTKVN